MAEIKWLGTPGRIGSPDLLKDELRGGWLGVPRAFTLLDFAGAALGAYFIFAGVTGRVPRWTLTALGTIMVLVHLQKFFYAPQTREGLARLLRELDVTPNELHRIADQMRQTS
jgi:hypothetical protein